VEDGREGEEREKRERRRREGGSWRQSAQSQNCVEIVTEFSNVLE